MTTVWGGTQTSRSSCPVGMAGPVAQGSAGWAGVVGEIACAPATPGSSSKSTTSRALMALKSARTPRRLHSRGRSPATLARSREDGMRHKIALIPGDGIGKEVVPAAARVLDVVGKKFGFDFEWTTFDWSCETYAKTGRMMPEDGLAQLRQFESIFLGAVGFPGVPDHVSLWGLLIPIRRGFHQYINLRPVRLLKGVRSPLAGRGPADIDMLIVRENNEGEYSEIGGRLFHWGPGEVAVQHTCVSREGRSSLQLPTG